MSYIQNLIVNGGDSPSGNFRFVNGNLFTVTDGILGLVLHNPSRDDVEVFISICSTWY